ncbi:large conductance mechanosensitive channel protein MscL [Dubosiella newyorkensis]|mgnify:CR=1 FL=1|jgi:large conductance mechanosensitive channel|uniref:large conductance mechanosensitive channel protein MscL n=2 Tax=Dubosiella newyorkensis TaxID=1862672 RepID=UPI002355720F|nr:large conductance mechanosensitive channel protein MscL [Dubosiella newyorkensis]MCI9041310.1 large conductance mechanosensitive channel protein MscL [Dubosiella newyorkensis]
MKKTMNEFKEFIAKGNVFSMAVGVVMGGAFTAIVNAIVEQLITPLIGLIMGGVDFSNLAFKVGEASFGYGAFIQAVVNFLIVALTMFFFVKAFAKFQKKEEVKEEVEELPSEEVVLLQQIRDLLSEKK